MGFREFWEFWEFRKFRDFRELPCPETLKVLVGNEGIRYPGESTIGCIYVCIYVYTYRGDLRYLILSFPTKNRGGIPAAGIL